MTGDKICEKADLMSDTTWRYTVEGTIYTDGTLRRCDEESGTVEAEMLGEAMIAVTRSATFWDWVDGNEKVTLTFERVSRRP